MVERVREVTIAVYVDTNKNTYSEVFDDVEEGRDYLQGLCNDLFPDWSQKEIDKIKWISVKDRLPEIDQWCSWWDISGATEPCTAFRGVDDIETWWENYTHWMPLPKPPEE